MNSDIPPSPLIMSPGSLLAIEREKKSGSKIHLPDVAKSKKEWGHNEFIVIAVGPEKMMENGLYRPMPYKVGQKIMFLFNQGVAFDYCGEKYIAMPQDAVIGVENETVMTALNSAYTSQQFAKTIAQ